MFELQSLSHRPLPGLCFSRRAEPHLRRLGDKGRALLAVDLAVSAVEPAGTGFEPMRANDLETSSIVLDKSAAPGFPRVASPPGSPSTLLDELELEDNSPAPGLLGCDCFEGLDAAPVVGRRALGFVQVDHSSNQRGCMLLGDVP